MAVPWRQVSPRQIEISREIFGRVQFKKPLQAINKEILDDILTHALECKSSDIDLGTGSAPWFQVEGYRHPICERKLSTSELRALADAIYGGSASTVLASGRSVNTAYEIKIDRNHIERFRVNMVQHDADGGAGLQLTIRHIPRIIPRLADLNVERELLPYLMPDQGMVAITGPTGSGKSTLLASIIQEEVLDEMSHRKFVTGERPIEFALRKIPSTTALVSQMEIGRDISGFGPFVREAMRRKAEVIVITECLDFETMSATNDAGNSGHLTHTSFHTKNVPDTVRRAINFFPAEIREGAALDFAGNARVIVNQILLPGADGKRRAAREFLVFTPEIRETLSDLPIAAWTGYLRQKTAEEGQTMASAVQRLVRSGEVLPDMIPQHHYMLEAA